MDNIIGVCNEIARQLSTDNRLPKLTRSLICNYNREVRRDLPAEPGLAAPGELREDSVVVGKNHRGAPAEDCPELLDLLCE